MNGLKGTIVNPEAIYGKSAYEIAVMHGFEGTEEEWLASLKGEPGNIDNLEEILNSFIPKTAVVTLIASEWKGTESPYTQEILIDCITANSKIDLNPTVEQLNIFHNKDLAFIVVNDNATATVYCIGQKPTNDYTMQATITEVKII